MLSWASLHLHTCLHASHALLFWPPCAHMHPVPSFPGPPVLTHTHQHLPPSFSLYGLNCITHFNSCVACARLPKVIPTPVTLLTWDYCHFQLNDCTAPSFPALASLVLDYSTPLSPNSFIVCARLPRAFPIPFGHPPPRLLMLLP